MRFYGYHGVNPEEEALGQRFVVRVRSIVEGERFDLIEAPSRP